jgi:hypothetical protein
MVMPWGRVLFSCSLNSAVSMPGGLRLWHWLAWLGFAIDNDRFVIPISKSDIHSPGVGDFPIG